MQGWSPDCCRPLGRLTFAKLSQGWLNYGRPLGRLMFSRLWSQVPRVAQHEAQVSAVYLRTLSWTLPQPVFKD